MTADEIRARYEAAIMTGLRVRVLRTSNGEIAAAILGELAAAGLLPTMEDRRGAYDPDGTPLGYAERQLLTAWQPIPIPATEGDQQ